MKILHVGKYFPPYAGGMETYLRDLMAAQARQGLDTAALMHHPTLVSTVSMNYTKLASSNYPLRAPPYGPVFSSRLSVLHFHGCLIG